MKFEDAPEGSPERGTEALSVENAFLAMEHFLRAFWERDGRGEGAYIRLLSFIDTSDPHHCPADPAMWQDWLDAIDAIRKRAS